MFIWKGKIVLHYMADNYVCLNKNPSNDRKLTSLFSSFSRHDLKIVILSVLWNLEEK